MDNVQKYNICVVVSCLTSYSALKMEEIFSSETSMDFYLTMSNYER
jgi:hypothetical protein